MKLLKIVLFLTFAATLYSCGSDDDICASGEGTPRLKLKFKTLATGKIRTLDTLYVDVDYGSGPVNVVSAQVAVDSLLLPLRVDDATYTDFYISTRKAGPKSKIRLSYTTQALYVSPACGFKKYYQNLAPQLLSKTPVLDIEKDQTQITNENKTPLYLLF